MITCDLTDLQNALSAAGLIEIKSSHEILKNSRIEKFGKKIGIFATDLEIGFKTWIDGTGETEPFCLNTKKTSELISKLTQCQIALDFDGKKTKIFSEEKHVRTKINLQALPVIDFPDIPDKLDDLQSITIQSDNLIAAFRKVQYSVSTDSSQFFLNGVLLELLNGKLSFVATDGRRLSFYAVEIEAPFNFSIIVPMKVINILTKVFKKDCPVQIYFSDKQIFFVTETIFLISNIIDGKFPDYKKLLAHRNNAKPENCIKIHREELVTKIDRISPLTDSKINQIVMTFGNGEIILSAQNENGNISDDLQCDQTKGLEPIALGMNYQYCLDVLRNSIESETFICQIISPEAPLVFATEEDPNFLALIMPMRVRV